MNWSLVAHQVACSAVYGAMARHGQERLPRAFVDDLLAEVEGHIAAILELRTRTMTDHVTEHADPEAFVAWLRLPGGRWKAVAYGPTEPAAYARLAEVDASPIRDVCILPAGVHPSDPPGKGAA